MKYLSFLIPRQVEKGAVSHQNAVVEQCRGLVVVVLSENLISERNCQRNM
jgi:hypothetical protein